jgi:hypothetical protein
MPCSYAIQLQQFQSLVICVQVQFALLTAPPSGTNGATELSAPGYARQTISLAATGVMCASNPAPIVFTATGFWPTCEYFGLYDLGGNFLYWGMLMPPVTSNGGTVTVAAGAAFVDWLNAAPNYNPDFGRLPVSSPPVAPIDSPTYVRQQMLVVADVTAAMASQAVNLRPAWYGAFQATGPSLVVEADPTGSVGSPFADPPSIPATDAVDLRPAWYGVFAQVGVLGSPVMGTLKPLRMLDATRGTSTGYTVSVPNGLAF